MAAAQICRVSENYQQHEGWSCITSNLTVDSRSYFEQRYSPAQQILISLSLALKKVLLFYKSS